MGKKREVPGQLKIKIGFDKAIKFLFVTADIDSG